MYFYLQESNPALRLKDEVIAATLLSGSGPSGSGSHGVESSAYGQDFAADIITESNSEVDNSVDSSIDWQYFDEKSYIGKSNC